MAGGSRLGKYPTLATDAEVNFSFNELTASTIQWVDGKLVAREFRASVIALIPKLLSILGNMAKIWGKSAFSYHQRE